MSDFNIGNYDTDKISYIKNYERFFMPLKEKNVKIFELGIFHGGSLLMWSDYFKNGHIVGLDIDQFSFDKDYPNISIYKGDQKDIKLLEKISKENAPEGFDIIIDDASHFGKETFISFIYLFKNHLKSGGLYVIEDWGTGFWPHYPDGRNITFDKHHVSYHLHNNTNYEFKQKGFLDKGNYFNKRKFKSHDFGMVGVVKQLVDELAMTAATVPEYTKSKQRQESMIENILFAPGQVFIWKA